MAHFDLTVVGAGPAAAAAVLALGDVPELRLAVVAPADDGSDKVGESLSPEAAPVLRELGLREAFEAQGFRAVPATFSAWGSPVLVERHALLRRGGLGHHLDRGRFERFLWEEAARRRPFERRAAKVRTAERERGDLALELDDGNVLRTRFVLDASGRVGAVARAFEERVGEVPLLGAYTFLEHVDLDVAPTPATLIEARPEGWWYSALLPDGRLVVCWFSDADLLPDGLARDPAVWATLVAGSEFTRRRIETGGFAIAGRPRIRPAGHARLRAFHGDGWIAAGDAALAFDPLSSHGITSALWSGRRAARAAVTALDGEPAPAQAYADALEQGWERYLSGWRAMLAAETRFADEPFWRRRRSG